MKQIYYIAILFFAALLAQSCNKDEYEIDYQDGYPSIFAGNWIAFEFQGGNIEHGVLSEPYDLVTALDPNRSNSLIIDKLYASDVRVRTEISDTSFSVNMGEMLEQVSTNTYNIKYVTARGYITENPVLIRTLYSLAQLYFEDMSFDESYIKDLLFMRAGFYDDHKAQVDTVLILGYRRTGFEEVNF